MADEGDLFRARTVVGGREVAAQDGADPEGAQELIGDVGSRVAARRTVDGDVHGRPVQVGGQELEGLLGRTELLEVHVGDLAVPAEERAARRIDEVDAREPGGIGEREAAQHDAVHHAEHGGDGADAEGEGAYRQGAERLFLDEDAEADTKVAANALGKHG